MAKKPASQPEAQWEPSISAFGGHPLHMHVPSFKAPAGAPEAAEMSGPATKLAEMGVTDAEQLVALAGIEEVHDLLPAALGTTKAELDRFVKEARKVLPAAVAAEMESALPAMFALGAMEPTTGGPAGPPGPATAAAAAGLPSSANLVANMSPIRRQGDRGTCVAFTLTAIHEYFRRVSAAPEDFSEQHLYHEAKLIDGAPTVCGTFQQIAASVLAGTGQCREAIWAYNPFNPCNNNGIMPSNARQDASSYRLTLKSISPK